jgi:hypothetical protein
MKSRSVQEVLGLGLRPLSIWAQVVLGCALVALWLLGRRYAGITHDATLYVAQGLRRLDPASFDRDLFFAFGAQDAYTIFPRLYAPLIDMFGAGTAAMLVTIVGQFAFFAAAAALVFRMTTGMARWWSLALLAAVSGYYGGVGTFRLAEPFATARTFAEPLVIAALAGTLAGRPRMALAALAAATLLHPLVAAPGIASVLLWHALGWGRMRMPVLAGLALAVAVALVCLGFMPRFDPPWLAAVLDRSPHLFISQWLLPDWSRFVWGLCVAWIAMHFVEARARRLVLAATVVGLVGVAASWIAVDLLNSAIAAGLQLWRAHWLLHLFAIVLVFPAIAGLWRRGNGARAAAACLAASCCFGRAELPASAVLAVLAVTLDASDRRAPGWMGERALRLALLAALCAASVGLLFELQARLPPQYGLAGPADWTDYVNVAGSVGGLLPLAFLLWVAACSRFSTVALVLAASAFAVSVAAWDARAPWQRFIEQAGQDANPFQRGIAPGAQVFWPDRHSPAWIALGRATWFSADQGAGIVFSRDTAIEYSERKRVSRDLISANENCAFAGRAACRIETQRVQALCEHRDGPDYLVLHARIDGLTSIDWPLVPGVLPGVRSLHLYSCGHPGQK